ncbi:folate family ECF transporter S component [Alkalicella caledoniensis]|uniref:Folate family ECF transporter S component n=1 Tax=Alkalicella caledoniensis TaxID=2731377 RepID=A0A7G9W767_ALKCA|nr:folate family ECF transporter S component [Alkalicella caledoniensis]QNO14529.1 folate family ECF transporter S component [Alkalicella caledoniensis]
MQFFNGLTGFIAENGISILQVALVLVITPIFLSKVKERSQKITTQGIAISAMLMAVSIVLTRVASIIVPLGGLPGLRLGFGPIPIMIGSIMLGPFLGAMVGAGADLLGSMLASQGAFSPFIFISQTLYGVIPFYVLYLFKNKNSYSYLSAVVLTQLICGIITSYGLAVMFGRTFGEYYILRIPGQIILMAAYSIIIGLMHSHIYRVKKMVPMESSR